MRALEAGTVSPDDAAVVEHLDHCLGCRGCEPVCPAGVGYGRGLESARRLLAAKRGIRRDARLVLAVFRRSLWWRPAFGAARVLRRLRWTDGFRGNGRLASGMAMVAATRPILAEPVGRRFSGGTGPRVALFRGCVMDALFDHVHQATRRTLEANGYQVVEVSGQGCCGALHDHAGDLAAARALAERNVAAFPSDIPFVVVNSAGCGALLKDYGHLLGTQAAESFGGRVRDVAELLADRGPRRGGPVELDLVYDAACHLHHAQRVGDTPAAVLAAIPGLRIQALPGSEQCCGSAGIYSVLEPALSQAVLARKLDAIASLPRIPDLVATGNPGCLMQIGGGLRRLGLKTRVAHPVEVLDWSYRAGGVYEPSAVSYP
jgi:glycolate oxidase iron-sulfur subunit